MPLQLRRGTQAELNTVTPVDGEPIYVTDIKGLVIGDGVTQGGNRIGGLGNLLGVSGENINGRYTQITDLYTSATITILNQQGGNSIAIGNTGTRITGPLFVNTANITRLVFADGSVQTTADTSNPDQSLNTTSNVRFNSAVIATTATVAAIRFADGSIQTTADEANFNQALNTYNDVQFNTVTIPNVAVLSTASITASVDILPNSDLIRTIGSESLRFNNVYSRNVYTYESTSTSLTQLQQINIGSGAGPTILFGRGPLANSNLPAASNIGYREAASGWNGATHTTAYQKIVFAAGAWNTSTSVNMGMSSVESLAVPNLRYINEAQKAFPVTITNRSQSWGATPATTWPPVFQDIEGIQGSVAAFALTSKGDNTATTITNLGTVKTFVNTQLWIAGPPTQDSTSTTAGYNSITILGARLSGLAGNRRSLAGGDTVGEIKFRGMKAGDSGGGPGSDGASIQVSTIGDWLSTSTYCNMLFNTVEKDSTTISQRMELNSEVTSIRAKTIRGADLANEDLFLFRKEGGGNVIWNTTTFQDDIFIGGGSGTKLKHFVLTAISGSSANTVGTFDTAFNNAAKFVVSAVDSGEIHFAEVSVISDGTNIWKVEYGTNTSNGALGTFSVAMNGTIADLQFTPTSATNMTIKCMGTLL